MGRGATRTNARVCGGTGPAQGRCHRRAKTMDTRTAQKRAQELLHHRGVAARIAELRAEASAKASLSRAWVLERLMRNAEVALGDRTIKTKVIARNKETGEVSVAELEITDRDASAANRALELLGKTDEVRLILDRHEHSGEGGQPLVAEHSNRDLARAVLDILRTANLSDAPAPVSANKSEEPLHHSSAEMSAETPPADGGTRCPTAAPDSASAATIKRVGLAPGESEVFENGAFIFFDGERNKYGCY